MGASEAQPSGSQAFAVYQPLDVPAVEGDPAAHKPQHHL